MALLLLEHSSHSYFFCHGPAFTGLFSSVSSTCSLRPRGTNDCPLLLVSGCLSFPCLFLQPSLYLKHGSLSFKSPKLNHLSGICFPMRTVTNMFSLHCCLSCLGTPHLQPRLSSGFPASSQMFTPSPCLETYCTLSKSTFSVAFSSGGSLISHLMQLRSRADSHYHLTQTHTHTPV